MVVPTSSDVRVRDRVTVGPSAPIDRLVEELVRLTDTPDVRTQDLASLLAHLRPREIPSKLRPQVVRATRALLGRVPRYLPAEDLAEVLSGLTPPYLAEGTVSETHELLSAALPRLGGHILELDAENASSILRSLATLPLDEPRKAAAADFIVAIAPRLRDLASVMGPAQLAGSVQGLRLLRRANRALMLELLALLLRHGIDASPWEPSGVLDLARGLLTVRPDPDALTLAAEVLKKALPAIAPRCGELSTSEVSEIASVLGLLALDEPAPHRMRKRRAAGAAAGLVVHRQPSSAGSRGCRSGARRTRRLAVPLGQYLAPRQVALPKIAPEGRLGRRLPETPGTAPVVAFGVLAYVGIDGAARPLTPGVAPTGRAMLSALREVRRGVRLRHDTAAGDIEVVSTATLGSEK